MLHNVCTDTSQMIFDSLQQRKPDIAHLDVFSMIHDLLHFFHDRNQPNFTLVVVKFYNGLRKVHYRERFNHVSLTGRFVPTDVSYPVDSYPKLR